MFEFLVGIPAFVLLLIGLLALIGRPRILASYAKAIVGAIPLGTVKLWAMIFVVVGLIFGGIAGATMTWNSITGLFTTATITEQEQELLTDVIGLNCYYEGAVGSDDAADANISWRSDKNDRQHYYVDVENDTGMGSKSLILNLTCTRDNVGEDAVSICHAEADSFRNEVSTTDSNTYFIVETGTTKSKIPGYDWEQSIYLQDEGTSTSVSTASDKEETRLTFSESEASQGLNVYATLPGDTIFNYLDEQSSRDISIICDGEEVFKLTITKIEDKEA